MGTCEPRAPAVGLPIEGDAPARSQRLALSLRTPRRSALGRHVAHRRVDAWRPLARRARRRDAPTRHGHLARRTRSRPPCRVARRLSASPPSATPTTPCRQPRLTRTSSARKSGTPVKTADQFARTCSRPRNARSGCAAARCRSPQRSTQRTPRRRGRSSPRAGASPVVRPWCLRRTHVPGVCLERHRDATTAPDGATRGRTQRENAQGLEVRQMSRALFQARARRPVPAPNVRRPAPGRRGAKLGESPRDARSIRAATGEGKTGRVESVGINRHGEGDE